MKQYELNRKKYKEVKKMDHGQMSDFCKELWSEGYEAGKAETEGPTEEEVRTALLSIKGVGEKKVEDIMRAVFQAK
jgi:endonuclease III-like uncharacterized protein